MTALTWVLVGYGAVAIGLWRWFGRWLLDNDACTSWGELAGLVAVTTFGVAIWGLWVVPALIRRLAHGDQKRVERVLFGESRKAKAKRQAERIAELEKELELR